MEQQQNHTPFLSDPDIVELYWQRDEAAIRETDRKYKPYLMTVARNFVRTHQDCEECLNDTYAGAWNAMPPSRPAVLKAFLTTIMRRVAVNRYHANRRQKQIPSEMTLSLSDISDIVSGEPSPAEEFDTKRLGGLISDYLHSLPLRRRYIFMGRYFMADPIDVIARELGVSRSTVNKELATIKTELKKLLESEGYSI